MPAISFSGTTSMGPFWAQILIGRKTQTCRVPRKRPIKKGDKLVLYWKQRYPKAKKIIHKIALAVCTDVKRMFYWEFAFDNAFARRDGFRNCLELQEWFGSPLLCHDDEYDVISFRVTLILPDMGKGPELILALTPTLKPTYIKHLMELSKGQAF